MGSVAKTEPEKLICSWMFIGAYIRSDECFPEMSFRVPGMQIWFANYTILDSKQKDEKTGEITLTFSIPPATRKVTNIPFLETDIIWGLSWNYSTDHFSNLSMDISSWLIIKPRSEKTLNWFIDQISTITTMLSFIAGTPMMTDCIETYIKDRRQKITVFGPLKNLRTCKYLNSNEFFIPYKEIESIFDQIIYKWFEVFPKILIPSQLALSILSAEELWVNIEFISLMQALEGFHRSQFKGIYLEQDQYELFKQFILNAIPSELSQSHKESLRSRINYGNEIALFKRIIELSNLFTKPIREKIFGQDGQVPRIWIDTRNYYTHWDEGLKDNILDLQSLSYTNFRMKTLLCVLYLDLMGIPQEIINNSLSNSSKVSSQLEFINHQS